MRSSPGGFSPTASLFVSAATFRTGTVEKLVFVFLNQLDLLLTLCAWSLGFYEANPAIRMLLTAPWLLLIFKTAVPMLIAWLAPAKLLLPATVFLCLVVGWNIEQLVVAFL